jgi:LPXTG-site transpeptidase (sortase) family protein
MKNKSKRRAKKLFLILSGIAIILGLGFCLIGPIKQLIRDYYAQQAVDLTKDAIIGGLGPIEYKVPATDALSVEGEDGETEYDLRDLAADMQDLQAGYETLTVVGLLEIPCLDVEEPIFDSISQTALRYGVGVFPGTGPIGSQGLTSIWGHRMKYGKILGNLQYLEDDIGELVIITTMDGVQHYYKIVATDYAADGDLMKYMDYNSYSTETVAILTCGYGTSPVTGVYHKWNTEFVVICQPWEGSLPGED